MVFLFAVDDFECLGTARREQKIVAADLVGDDRQHRTTAIGIENVSSRQINAVRIVDAASGRKPFGFIGARERDQICDLFAFDIDHAERLAFL